MYELIEYILSSTMILYCLILYVILLNDHKKDSKMNYIIDLIMNLIDLETAISL